MNSRVRQHIEDRRTGDEKRHDAAKALSEITPESMAGGTFNTVPSGFSLDSRLPPIVRQNAVMRMQQILGNRAVQRLLSKRTLTVQRDDDNSSDNDNQLNNAAQLTAMGSRAPVTTSSLRVTSQFFGSSPTYTNFGPIVKCQAPLLSLAGTVTVPRGKTNGDLTVGFMQALVSATGPKGYYWDADDNPYMTAFQPYTRLPVRDGEANTPIFYGPEAQSVVNSPTQQVTMSDQPQAALLTETPDRKGKLLQIRGDQSFITWMVVKSDSTGEIFPLQWLSWRIGWFAAVDPSEASGTAFDRAVALDKAAGQGPMAPIRSGAVANDSKSGYHWESWDGTY